MDVTRYVTALREDVIAAAAAGDEQTQRTAALLAAAIEPAARLAMMNALADLATEVSEALGDERTVEIRLDGREVKVVVNDPTPSAEPPPTPPPSSFGDAGDISRITLRLMEEIKGRAEQAANQQGVSLNSWISQAVQGALRGHQSGRWDDWARPSGGSRQGRSSSGNHLRGWVQG
jgi:uncharacterized protein (DUF1778 family)